MFEPNTARHDRRRAAERKQKALCGERREDRKGQKKKRFKN